MKNTPTEAAATHPLFSCEIRPLKDWNDWLEHWENASSLEERLGLLHTGFDVETRRLYGHEASTSYGIPDRIIFYFRIADGWSDHANILKLPTDSKEEFRIGQDSCGNVIKKSPWELRQILAEKAFDMLCLNFFRSSDRATPKRRDFIGSWRNEIANENLFPVIMNFFRYEPDQYGGRIPNLGHRQYPEGHNRKHMVNFLIDLTLFLWEWRGSDIASYRSDEERLRIQTQNEAMEKRVQEGRLLMLEVFAQLGKLELFEQMWERKLDSECLERLKKIAFRSCIDMAEHEFDGKRRRVETLEEACYAGSSAAWLLKGYEIRKSVQENLDARAAAEKLVRDGKRKLRELSSTK